VPEFLDEFVSAGDFVLTQGAGETSRLAQALKNQWQKRLVEK